MKLSALKKKYPNHESFYDAFLNSEDGKTRWEDAYDYDDIDESVDYILEGMEYWIYNMVDEKYMNEAMEWFEMMECDLYESIYAGLT